jgi:hypothetical protein
MVWGSFGTGLQNIVLPGWCQRLWSCYVCGVEVVFTSDKLKHSFKGGLKKGWEGFFWMFKIIVPVSFFTALLEYSGLLIAVFLLISHNLIQEAIIQAKSGLGALKATLVRLAASIATVIVISQFLDDGSKAGAAVSGTLSGTQPFLVMLKVWCLTTLSLFARILVIIMAIMIALEIMRNYNLIDYIVRTLNPVLKILGLEKKVGMLWITAVVFGLSYGGAVIVGEARNGAFSRAELENLHLSIGINHAIIEDPAIFMSLGLNPFWLWVPRFTAAVVAVHIFALWRKLRDGRASVVINE